MEFFHSRRPSCLALTQRRLEPAISLLQSQEPLREKDRTPGKLPSDPSSCHAAVRVCKGDDNECRRNSCQNTHDCDVDDQSMTHKLLHMRTTTLATVLRLVCIFQTFPHVYIITVFGYNYNLWVILGPTEQIITVYYTASRLCSIRENYRSEVIERECSTAYHCNWLNKKQILVKN